MDTQLTEQQINEINMQYLPRLTVKNAEEYIAKSAERSAAARSRLQGHIDVAYGNTEGQKLDIFPAAKPGAPVHVFIHGGYWRSLDKHIYSHVAEPMVDAGATVVVINYDLCPKVRVTDIVAQVRRSIVWVYSNISRYNADPGKIHVSGHSAGGHLTGMLIATDWQKEAALPNDLIKGTAPLSGLFDIEPHRHSQLQPDIRLTAEEARAMSPMYLQPVAKGPAIVALGGREPDLFHWQSLEYAARLRLCGIKAEYVATPGDNHFDITDRLGDPKDPLTQALIAQMGL
jgi:arylformamidase